jgi:Tfp pilus assembly protein PilF
MLSLDRHGAVARAAQALFGSVFYLWKTVVPFNLSPLHEIPQQVRLSDWPYLLSGTVVLALSLGLMAVRRRWPAGLAAWACYLVILSPTLGAAQSGPQFVADRYSYLSCLPWAILVGAGLYSWWRHQGSAGRRWRGSLIIAGIAALTVAGLGYLTWKQAGVWRDTESLWRYTVAAEPESSVAHYNLALYVEGQGKYGEAIEHYRRALAINPRYVRAHNNLGVMLVAQNRIEEAIAHYRQALEINPRSAETHNNLGNALFRRGEIDAAVGHYREALQSDPAYVKAYNGLGIALTRQGRVEEGISQFRTAIEINPDYASAYLSLANVLAGRGELEAAAGSYRRALDIDPKLAAAHEGLGRTRTLQGRREEAIRHMEEALRIMKGSPDRDGGQALPR